MQLGCCTAIENAPIAQAAGFDFLECTVVSLFPDEDDDVFAPILEKYQAAPLPVRAFNVFLPRDLKVAGPQLDQARLQRYLERALERVQLIGAEIVVFGSGGSRSIPEGFSRAEAVQQISRFLQNVADVADQTGVTIAIEPLNQKETNIINTVAEAAELAQQIDRPAIQALADFYHMDEENEPLHHLTDYKTWLAHVHVADTDRRAPGTGQYPYPTFVEQLRRVGYEGFISVECRWEDFSAEAGPAVQFLRRML